MQKKRAENLQKDTCASADCLPSPATNELPATSLASMAEQHELVLYALLCPGRTRNWHQTSKTTSYGLKTIDFSHWQRPQAS